MKTDKMAELRDDELHHEEERLAEQLFRFRFQIQTGNVENPSRLPQTRRDLARVKTILRERELGIERHRRSAADGEMARSGSESRLKSESRPNSDSQVNEEK